MWRPWWVGWRGRRVAGFRGRRCRRVEGGRCIDGSDCVVFMRGWDEDGESGKSWWWMCGCGDVSEFKMHWVSCAK